MSDIVLKEQIRATLDRLPDEELPELMDFINYLVWRAGRTQSSVGTAAADDVLVGLFDGPVDLATEAENLTFAPIS